MERNPGMAPPVTAPAGRDRSAPPGVYRNVAASDGDLVVRSRAGDADAFATLAGRLRGRFLRYARNMLDTQEDAEEAVQDTLVRIHRSLGRADPDRFDPWAFRILVNRCRTAARRRRWWRRIALGIDAALPVATAPAAADGALREEIDRALATLPVEQREAFILRHVDDLSYDEMQALTGASVPALKMRVSRACARLRQELEHIA